MSNRSWQVAVSPDDFTSMKMAKDQICTALPVSGVLVKTVDPSGKWLFLVSTQIDTQEEVERLLKEAGIPATVSPLAPAA